MLLSDRAGPSPPPPAILTLHLLSDRLPLLPLTPPPPHTHTQDDILLPTTTPREALQFAAALRLPTPHFTKQQQAAAVDRLIDGMKLEHCADTLVRHREAHTLSTRHGPPVVSCFHCLYPVCLHTGWLRHTCVNGRGAPLALSLPVRRLSPTAAL